MTAAPAIVPTVDLVKAFPHHWIAGEGNELASRTQCPHGYFLTDSCPGCDYDTEDHDESDPPGLRWTLTQPLADTIDREDIYYWARLQDLDRDAAAAFADRLHADLNDWVDPANGTVRDVFTTALHAYGTP